MTRKTGEISAVSVGVNSQGEACLRFSDAAFVRADAVIIDRRDSSVHAVLHESAHHLGFIDGAQAGAFKHKQKITLSAPNHAGGTVHLTSTVLVV